jgi:predicted CoA-binding protein
MVMTGLSSIRSFLEPRELAVAGVSRNPKKFGRYVYEHLRTNGYKVYPVNPNTDNLDGAACYRNILDLPDHVDRVYIVTPPEQTAECVRQCLQRGIRNIWIQQRSDSKETLDLLKDEDLSLIRNRCIMMFADPVKGAHAFHRFMARLFGSYPRH